ncbi:MAG: K(+)-transporting ATPase subunit C [Candidatus Hydrogenedentes bacterium]|nr:K(+)-transporting ATPase subunit C [Candidatus Hydrogenedentota bacterium]
MQHVITSVRLVVLTMLVCCAGYTAVIWGLAYAVTPWTAEGSLITDASGRVVGSARIAQEFTQARYFWPRPSAVGYNAAATGGSNLSPTNPKLVERLQPLLEAHGANAERPLPADLATASGSGLDPHITLAAARYQAPRVATARGLSEQELMQWLERRAETPGGLLGSGKLIHVLNTNLALDRGEVH